MRFTADPSQKYRSCREVTRDVILDVWRKWVSGESRLRRIEASAAPANQPIAVSRQSFDSSCGVSDVDLLCVWCGSVHCRAAGRRGRRFLTSCCSTPTGPSTTAIGCGSRLPASFINTSAAIGVSADSFAYSHLFCFCRFDWFAVRHEDYMSAGETAKRRLSLVANRGYLLRDTSKRRCLLRNV